MYETNIVNRLNKEIDFKAQRFAEGGSKDLGDIQLFVKDEEYFLEAKSRQNLNPRSERVRLSTRVSACMHPCLARRWFKTGICRLRIWG